MARSRGGSSRPAPRPAARTAPPPAQRSSAPPPAPQQSGGGGGLMGGLAGMVMQGAAMGTGSAMAHRAVDAVMGPRTMHVEAAPAAESAAPVASAAASACANQMKAFTECLNTSDGDISRCQFYHDALQQCKRGGF